MFDTETYIKKNKDWNMEKNTVSREAEILWNLHPKKQGLKPCQKLLKFLSLDSLKPTSKKTRIETAVLNELRLRRASSETYIQKNKDWNNKKIEGQTLSDRALKPTSKKTRIETW